MRINLFETSMDGHRPRYLREIIFGLKAHRKDCDLRLCIFDADRQTHGYLEFLKPFEDQFRVCPLPNRTLKGRFRSEITRMRLLHDCIVANPCDRVIIPYGDGLVPMMGALPKWMIRRIVPATTQMESMLFSPTWAYPSANRIDGLYRQIRRWAIVRWPGVRLHFSDLNALGGAGGDPGDFVAQVDSVPEVLDDWQDWDRRESHRWLVEQGYVSSDTSQLLQDSYLVSSPGLPSIRKGSVVLIEAFVKHVQRPGIRLLVWGKLPIEVTEKLRRRGVDWQADPRIVFIHEHVTDLGFRVLLSMTDLVALPYQNHIGLSSVYLISAIHRKKTLCDDRGWLGWAVGEYSHGVSMRCSEPRELAKGIEVSRETETSIASPTIAERLRLAHTRGNFGTHWGRD